MTVLKAIEEADRLRPNSLLRTDKLEWLRDFELRIKNEVYSTHKNDEKEFTDMSDFGEATVLFLVAPYDEAYIFYLCSMIDFFNAEYDRYNNDCIMLENLYGAFERKYNSRYESLPQTLISC